MGERVLLTWLNYCYANYKDKIWSSNDRGGLPPTRWIVNFDADLTDSLTLGALLGAYCPFIVIIQKLYIKKKIIFNCILD